MRRMKLDFERAYRSNFSQLVTAAVALLIAGCFPSSAGAQQPGQKTFQNARQASHAFFMAVRSNDQADLLAILGPAGKEILSSGDAAQDSRNRINFASKYQELHRLVKEPDGTVTLYIGAENWPTPIPLVEKSGVWFFDTAAGKKEILMRRVGRNELSAIRVCQELVAAEHEYRAAEHNVYAAKFNSDAGQQNGLYWPASGNSRESFVGPLVAEASISESDALPNGPMPFRGYYFRILTRQGKDAPGGAKDYVVNGKMTAGFAFVAYPAEYRNSGVMTFIAARDRVIYQKDLGEKTAEIAKGMTEYNPDMSWQTVEEQMQETADMQKTK